MRRTAWSPPEGTDPARPALHIAKKCGVAVTTVLRWMRRNSLAIGPRGAPPGTTWEWSNKLDPATLDWTRQDTYLAPKHGVCRERIRQLRKAAGLPASGSAAWLAAGGVVTNPSPIGKKSKLAVDEQPAVANNGVTK